MSNKVLLYRQCELVREARLPDARGLRRLRNLSRIPSLSTISTVIGSILFKIDRKAYVAVFVLRRLIGLHKRGFGWWMHLLRKTCRGVGDVSA